MPEEKVPVETKKPTFKLVATVVMAMRRFQAAINPTYTYGAKRPASPDALAGLQAAGMPRNASGRTGSGLTKTLSGRDSQGKHHGYKGNMLFKPLPPLPSEQETSA